MTERSELIFAILWQFPTDLERSAGCQQSIFFLHINEQIIFSRHSIEQTIFFCQFREQIIFSLKNHTLPPGIKWSAPKPLFIEQVLFHITLKWTPFAYLISLSASPSLLGPIGLLYICLYG